MRYFLKLQRYSLSICALASILSLFCAKTGQAQENKEVEQLLENVHSSNDSIRFASLKELHYVYSDRNLDSAKLYLDELQAHAKKTKNVEHIATSLGLQGRWFDKHYEVDSSLYYYRKAIPYYRSINNIRGLAGVNLLIGNLYADDEKIDSALFYYFKAEEAYLSINSAFGLARIYTNLGVIYSDNLGDQGKSIEYYYKALKYDEEEGDVLGQAILHINIANQLSRMGRLDEAEEEAMTGVSIVKAMDNWRYLSLGYTILSGIYLERNDKEKGINYAELSLEYAEKINDPEHLLLRLNYLGNTYEFFEEWDKVLPVLERCLNILPGMALSEVHRLYHMAQVHLGLALNYAKLGNIAKHKYHLSIAEQLKVPTEKLLSSEYLNLLNSYADVYESTGMYKKALHYFYLIDNLEDSLYTEENNQAISELKTKYETEKKEQEIMNLQQVTEIQSLTIDRKNYQIITALLVILFLVGFGYSYGKQAKLKNAKFKIVEEKKKLLEEELDKKSRMLTTTSVQWINMAEQLNKLKLDLKKEFDEVDATKSKKLIRRIERIKDFENQWDSFKIHFESVHPHYFDELQNLFPELTSNDLKICAFIKMKHNNGEIAQILSITKRAVEQSKRRLKKKLNLSYQEDLQHFLDHFHKNGRYTAV